MDSLRISDADRDAAVAVLGEHFALGRLTKEEFDERSDAVWSARTQGDLTPLFADLPGRSATQRRPAPEASLRPRWWPVPLAPVLAVLVVLTVVTHLPFVLLLVLGFLCFGRWHRAGWGGRRRW